MASQQTNGIADDNASEEFWQFLKPELDEIWNEPEADRDQLAGLSHKVYKHCSERKTLTPQLLKNLKQDVTNYVTTLFEVTNDLPDEELLRYNVKQWKQFQRSSKAMNTVFEFLNDAMKDLYMESEAATCYRTDEFFNVTWKEQLYEPLLVRVPSIMHQLIEADRHGEIAELRDVSGVINSWMELNAVGPCEEDTGEPFENLATWTEAYTNVFIENMTTFFKQRSMELFERCSFVEYMQEAIKTLNEEDKRIQCCLIESVRDSATNITNRIWIEEHSELFLKEFKNFLSTNTHENLGLLHKLVFRVPRVYEDFQEVLKNHITIEFSNALVKEGKDAVKDPKIYGKLTLDVYSKYDKLIKNSFGSTVDCKAALSIACGNFFNNDHGTEKEITAAKSSELLAKYCDSVLKASKDQDEAELEVIVNRIVQIFESMKNKDVFYTFYGKYLAKRLVQKTSANLDIESYVITKLKENCGDGATKYFHNMFQDIVISKDLNKAYRKHSEADKTTQKNDHAVQVISTGSWPFEKSPQLNIFPEVECFISNFTDFYVGRHSGRKLSWLHHLSVGELVSTCFKNRYTIQASTFQVAILLRFNDASRYSIQKLHEDTGIRLDYLKQVIQLLLKSRLLVHEEDGELNKESHVALFKGYKNKKSRVNINVPLKIEQKVEQNTTYYDIQRERRMLIQAAIVRIMKTRQKCYHDDLVVEIINELSCRFDPTITMIKKCIADLIEKEYIDRKPNKINKYRYIA